MIIDLERFIQAERPCWQELERILERLEGDPGAALEMAELRRFHYLYQRAASDLARAQTFASEPELQHYLEALSARAYGEAHDARRRGHRFRPIHWFFHLFPQTFRRRKIAFAVSLVVTLAGVVFGCAALALDPESKDALIRMQHLQGKPSERVAHEESEIDERNAGEMSAFSSYLITNNIKVSILTMGLGVTFGIGSIIVLFSNGVMLGAVAMDYLLDGQARFMLGWLLPHGSIEIPAIVLAGQAGFVIAGAMIGWGDQESMKARLRKAAPDTVSIIGGVAVMLVWAGIVEGFLSQYHEPYFPYLVKIAFGAAEFMLLWMFLGVSGRNKEVKE